MGSPGQPINIIFGSHTCVLSPAASCLMLMIAGWATPETVRVKQIESKLIWQVTGRPSCSLPAQAEGEQPVPAEGRVWLGVMEGGLSCPWSHSQQCIWVISVEDTCKSEALKVLSLKCNRIAETKMPGWGFCYLLHWGFFPFWLFSAIILYVLLFFGGGG